MNANKIAGILTIMFATAFLLIFIWLISGYDKARQPVSYLPDIKTHATSSHLSDQEPDTFIAKTSWYNLKITTQGEVELTTPDSLPIISSLSYFSSCEGFEDKAGLLDVSAGKINDSIFIVSGTSVSGALVNISVRTDRTQPKIDFLITTKYKNEVVVNRESLVVKYEVPVSEVFKKNRKTDTENFKSEYWLDKQGVKLGNDSRSALIYHTPGISSLQLNTRDSLLFINLDYFRDHPFIPIPFQPDGRGRWTDCSPSLYQSNAERVDSFSVYVGYLPRAVPRIMLLTGGFVAGHAFTEHADGGERIGPHLAAYYGADSITDIDNASGGFAGHRIPVTKSVMFCDSTGKLSDPVTEDTSVWNLKASFLDQLNKTGLYDICLHTPEELNSNRQTLAEAIPFMKERYDARSWIDHGMYDGNMNRECFVCDGLNPASEYYAADLWDEYDTRYFWSSAVELIRNRDRISTGGELKRLRFRRASESFWTNHLSSDRLRSIGFFKSLKEVIRLIRTKEEELNSLLPAKGDSMPTPLWWEHPSYAKGFYSWVTDYVKDYRDFSGRNAEMNLENEMRQIDGLISNWGIFLNHGYYVRGHEILAEQNGRLQINPYFDRLLGYMEDNQEKGSLLNTTVRDLLDYWILTENVSFTYFPDGTIGLYNNNEQEIEGLSMAVKAQRVFIDGVSPASRRSENDLVFWFDMPAKTRKIIRVE
jgi:hypothetical protein